VAWWGGEGSAFAEEVRLDLEFVQDLAFIVGHRVLRYKGIRRDAGPGLDDFDASEWPCRYPAGCTHLRAANVDPFGGMAV
jgi:hypothetical protein